MNKALNRVLQEIKYGNMDEFYEFMQRKKINKVVLNELLVEACKEGYTDVVKTLIEDGRINPKQNYHAIYAAEKYNHKDIIRLLS